MPRPNNQTPSHESPKPEKPPESWLLAKAKDSSAAIVMAIIFGLYTFVWNSHDSERDLKYRVDALEKSVEKLTIADKEQIETQNQFLIGLTKISEAQNRLAVDVKDMQLQQQKNTEMLLNRK